jgi:hypothetical protein
LAFSGEADLDAGRIDRLAVVGNIGRFERRLDGLQRRRVELDVRFVGRYLDRGNFGEEVRKRVDDTYYERDADEDVLPEWITIHGYVGPARGRSEAL